jgi:hypothetical protein
LDATREAGTYRARQGPQEARPAIEAEGDGQIIGGAGRLGLRRRPVTLYEQGVDVLHIGIYVRRWLRWTRSALRALGAGLSERAFDLVVRSLVRLVLLGGCLPPLFPAVAGQTDDGCYAEPDPQRP